ncbi:MAG: bifunctional phosphopantothenoylcysteine decarboxylase/phosphopantothenate--cysteine ligase CoaBC [Flavobacterium sp.]|nr:bifunctional phosphopantothenoylcysteine decarboxylase/phosphopantothenate--cysteine ligase CoaBC [Flavobacterium sp.]
MSVLRGKKIVLGISGGIAAYKTASLVRLFIKAGAEVQVIMTPASVDFVTPLTLATLSKRPVYSTIYNQPDPALQEDHPTWNKHVDLALWADYMLVAPATANTLAKMAQGNCDNLLLAVYLSAKCPVYFAPAMDLDMYKHPTTLANFATLTSFGHVLIPAETGELASGLSGEGRMAEPENIVAFMEADIANLLPLKGKTILITAGPTFEAIDPVRFIGNHSTGKMGFDIAKAAICKGAQVILITGPTHLDLQDDACTLIRVMSAAQMYAACQEHFTAVDVAICAAAVADYRPAEIALQKIKKSADELNLTLEKTQDILASLGLAKTKQVVVGFALETENEIEHAIAKIQKKNLDLIVLNSLQDEGAGFGKPTNKVTFIDRELQITPMPLKSKEAVADDLLNILIAKYYA